VYRQRLHEFRGAAAAILRDRDAARPSSGGRGLQRPHHPRTLGRLANPGRAARPRAAVQVTLCYLADHAELGDLLGLASTATSRFTTVRATVLDWSHYRRICELQGLPWTAGDAEEAGERRTRIWVSADRNVREELDTGAVIHGDALDELR